MPSMYTQKRVIYDDQQVIDKSELNVGDIVSKVNLTHDKIDTIRITGFDEEGNPLYMSQSENDNNIHKLDLAPWQLDTNEYGLFEPGSYLRKDIGLPSAKEY